jgi:hypothetical protein
MNWQKGAAMNDIKEHVKGSVTLLYYRKGELWYECESGFRFPVPVSDCGDGTFLPSDRAMLFMRYIRRAMGEQR